MQGPQDPDSTYVLSSHVIGLTAGGTSGPRFDLFTL